MGAGIAFPYEHRVRLHLHRVHRIDHLSNTDRVQVAQEVVVEDRIFDQLF